MSHETRTGAATPLRIEADVLVIGGGMAACWAAISAARAGAEVVLVDKGYVATAGPGIGGCRPTRAAGCTNDRMPPSSLLAQARGSLRAWSSGKVRASP